MKSDDLFHVAGKSAVIAGGNGSIGLEISRLLASQNAVVTVLDRNSGNVQNESGVSWYTVELRNVKEMSETMNEIGSKNGIDILIHTAGINPAVQISDITEEDWDNVIESNLKSCLFFVKLGYPYMKNKGGAIVLISSITSLMGFKGLSLYGTSKGGINSMVKSLACELAEDNIRVNAVAPGTVRTPMTRDFCWGDKNKLAAHEATVPMDRIAEPEDIANSVLYFASDLSSYVTGQILYVDGGMSVMQADYIDLNLRGGK